ncbi:hypothetical protein EDC39_10370 [Geothermobacter ehrlichii]|uniref:Glycosyl transferase family 2 n=1 Tax=Geothermobacter ehrlichii TaxID=213224 RepID=A0A5D3WLB3_9BACT|nr:glycosyltransferase family 2 protein [Geothermobacter ehrlichii]TYO99227.1 hypothetical protein EDC39_10370 [Geothermobacter ehrlichii]
MSIDLSRYRKRLLIGPWRLEGSTADHLDGAVVIPACGESDHLPATLAGLAANPEKELRDWLVVVVVNQPPSADERLKEDNLATLDWLHRNQKMLPHLAWVDATDEGTLFPARDAGVGLARKTGFDLALERLRGPAAILVSLDADTLVEDTYLPALRRHFATHAAGGATLPFRHQPAAGEAEQRAIDLYELYLRHYVLGLRLAGSSYAYHSIGSAFACRADAYIAAGGMNRRKAGEDFYFLQQLAKTSGVRPLGGTCVHPSSRTSQRVPFGTGEKVARLARGEPALLFPAPAAFRQLRLLLDFEPTAATPPAAVLDALTAGAPEAAEFLRREGWTDVWPRLCRQHRRPERLRKAFHDWFDALKTWRLIRLLSASHPVADPEAAVRDLLAAAGLDGDGDTATLLEKLRRLENDGEKETPPDRKYAMLAPSPPASWK